MARYLASAAVPAVLGTDPLVQLLDLDDLVEAARLAAHQRFDGPLNLAGDGVLPLSTVIKLSGRLRAAMPETALRAALQALWVVGAGLVPGAHAAFLRDTYVADTTALVAQLGFRPRYGITGVLAHHASLRRGAMRFAA
jgi:UDP-glucose 4-epimerase